MRFVELEKEAAKIYSTLEDIPIKYLSNDITKLSKKGGSRENTIRLLYLIDFKMSLLEILPELSQRFTNEKTLELSERINDIRKKFQIEDLLERHGGLFIDSNELTKVSTQDSYNGQVVEYNLDGIYLDPYPISYNKIGLLDNIKTPDKIFSITGVTNKELAIKLDLTILNNTDSCFIDTAGCDILITGNSTNIKLNDGWTNINLTSGSYTIELTPAINNNNFNIIIRHLFFMNKTQTPARFSYDYNITYNGRGLGGVVVGGQNSIITIGDQSAKDDIFVGDYSFNNLLDINANDVDTILDDFVTPTLDPSTQLIGVIGTDINNRGTILSEKIQQKTHSYTIETHDYTTETITIYTCYMMLYVKDILTISPPTSDSRFSLYKISKDGVDKIYTPTFTTRLTHLEERINLLGGLYIISYQGNEESGFKEDLRYLNNHCQFGIILPGYSINGNIYTTLHPSVVKLLQSLGVDNVYYQSRYNVDISGSINITSEKPISGFILLQS